MKKIVLIVAGGSGTRMNSEIPKQFIEIAGMPVLMHTFSAFYQMKKDFEFVLVLPKLQFENWRLLCLKHNFQIKHSIVPGGETRFDSVKNGLDFISENGIVLIHDAVRPFVSESTINSCIDCAISTGNALPVVPVADSVRIVNGTDNKAADRSQIFLVQTPQTFRIDLIKNAYFKATGNNFTDDATVLENTGVSINLVAGNRENIKITTPADFPIAEALLKSK